PGGDHRYVRGASRDRRRRPRGLRLRRARRRRSTPGTVMPFARRMSRVNPSAIMELIKSNAAGSYVPFASGLPDPCVFPQETLRALTDDVLTRDGRAALQYGAAEGYAPLRAYVAEMLSRRGLKASPEQVVITTGSQQALDLAARALLDPDDAVVIESPSYLAGIQIFDSAEVEYR